MTQLIILMIVVFSMCLWLIYRRHHHQILRDRAALLSESHKVIDIKQRVLDQAGFAHLAGEFAGTSVALKLEVDNLTARKLPIMWLHITMLRPAGSEGSLDILMRPQSGDVFSPGWNWERPVTPPKNWPQHARYVSKNKVPSLQRIDGDIQSIFADQRVKALLITPDAVRLTYLARQGDRGQYLLLRMADFDMQPLDPTEIAALSRQLQTLLFNLDGGHYEKAA